MSHTLPPWTSKYKLVKVFGNIDNNELAARLGALSVQDRRGNLVWYDNFEGLSINWFEFAFGTGAGVALDSSKYWLGSQSLQIKTGDSTANTTYIQKYFSLPELARIGLECMVWLKDDECRFAHTFYGFTGSQAYSASLRFTASTGVLEYWDVTSQWVEIDASVNWKEDVDMWLLMKLVIDWTTGKYVRAIVGDTEYNLSEYSYASAADATKPAIALRFVLATTDNANRIANIDNVILTQNEP